MTLHVKCSVEPDIQINFPTTDDVFELMERILHDDEIAPCVCLTATENSPSDEQVNASLQIHRLMDAGFSDACGWLVRFLKSGDKRSIVLAKTMPVGDRFRKVEMCGAWESIRTECRAEEPLIAEAVRWFLEHGGPNPALVWLDFFDALRHFDS